MRKFIHETISNSQGAFVKGRQILDAILIANVVVDEKRRSRRKGLCLKNILKKRMIIWIGVS